MSNEIFPFHEHRAEGAPTENNENRVERSVASRKTEEGARSWEVDFAALTL